MNRIEFQKIRFNNFRSFRGEHEFDFTQFEPGLYQISGVNGAGKTGFLPESLYWTLYGKTTRNLKAGNIHSWGTKGSTASQLEFTVNNSTHVLERQWNPNKLQLDGQEVSDQPIQDLIKFNSESLKYSAFIPQFGRMFFDLTPTEKLQLFSSLLDLDYWLDRSKEAQKQEKQLDSEINELKQDMQYKEGRIEQLVSQAEDYEQQLETFDDKQREKIKANKKEVKDYKDEVSGLESQLENQSQDEIQKLETQIKKVQEDKSSYQELLDSKQKEYKGINQSLSDVRAEKKNVSKNLKKFDTLDAVCPSCEQEITDEHVNACKKAYNETLSELEEDEQEYREQLEGVEEDISDVKGDIDDLNTREKEIRDQMSEAKNTINKLETKLDSAQRNLDRAEKELQDVEAEENPYEGLLDQAVNNIEKLETEAEKQKKQVNKLEKQLAAVGYWVKGFKDLRLYVVEDVLTHLQVQVNNYIHDLGLEGWNIELDVQKENKSGGVSKGFQVMISSPESKEPVPWEVFSGGEGMRLRLAGMLGLSNLICQSYGMDTNIMVLDEPTTHLSSSGIESLLTVLDEKAISEEKQIWLIDHHVYEYPFKGTISVDKDEQGSQILPVGV